MQLDHSGRFGESIEENMEEERELPYFIQKTSIGSA